MKIYKADMNTKSVEKMLTIETEGICTCVIQLSKTYLALSSNDVTFVGHTDVVFALKLLKASASIFASCSNDKTIRIWKAG